MIKKDGTGELEFRYINSSTGNAVTGYTFGVGEVKMRLPGAGAFSNVAPGDITEIGNGAYAIQLDATDTATEGKVYYYIDTAVLTTANDEFRCETIMEMVNTAAIADAVWDEVIENGKTARKWLRGIKSVLWGKLAITETTRAYRDDADTKARVSATISDSGRLTITEDLD